MLKIFKTHPKLSWLAVTIAVIATVVAALELTNMTYWFHDKPAPYTASEYTKGDNAMGTDAGNTSSGLDSGSSSPSADDDKTTGSAGTTLVIPSGNFVSSHHVSASSNLLSTCNTTPGAICTITLTKESSVKSLPAKTIDRGGAAYWDWQPSDIGLTAGQWSITATATLNGQSLKGEDVMPLIVSQ